MNRSAAPAGEIRGARKTAIEGIPDPSHISASYAERQNLTTRMHMRRYIRLTNAFSKKFDNHVHMAALYTVWHSHVKQHKSPKGLSPAMAAGLERISSSLIHSCVLAAHSPS